ncbi:MAG: hypothetical protein ABSF95_03790 [Verrucomicrobiota bacterium]|jgi:hypothetical protein
MLLLNNSGPFVGGGSGSKKHLVAELNGTQLRYELRNQLYLVDLDTAGCRLAVEGFSVRHVLCDLQPGVAYTLRQDGRRVGSFRADAAGRIGFNRTLEPSKEQRFELAGQ